MRRVVDTAAAVAAAGMVAVADTLVGTVAAAAHAHSVVAVAPAPSVAAEAHAPSVVAVGSAHFPAAVHFLAVDLRGDPDRR